MFRSFLLVSAATGAVLASCAAARAQQGSAPNSVETVTVTANRLNKARDSIQTQIGASTYTFDSSAIEAQPGGTNNPLNQVILQAPGVVQDSYGQLHIRAEHNALQYRLNGVILPEGISVFSQTLDPRLAGSVQLITGSLPAEYGLVTGGIVDVRTKNGLFASGGEVSMYGGSHDEIEPSASYGGSIGNWNYFVTGNYTEDDLGIESPDGSADPLHDHTQQYHGFGYAEDVLTDDSRLAMVVGTSHDQFQIPDVSGQSASFAVSGAPVVASQYLNDNQTEITHFATVSYLQALGDFNFQISGLLRFSSLYFSPDEHLGDLEYLGISQQAYKRNIGYGVQAEGEYDLSDAHTMRGGILIQREQAVSNTTSEVLPATCTGMGSIAAPYSCTQSSTIPEAIIDDTSKNAMTYSAYLQDEWKVLETLTINYGLRYDRYEAYSSGSQFSPRVNAVWKPLENTTVHAGYARYFSPPPFELVGSETLAKFANPANFNTATPAVALGTTPIAERAHYFDAGVQQIFNAVLASDDSLTLGVDSFYKLSKNLIDEGQFGAPIILTPFNYRNGRQYGINYSATYTEGSLSAYGNLTFQKAYGEGIFTSQLVFSPDDLTYTQNHYIHLDHDQAMTASAGTSYLFPTDTRVSFDMLYGAGLRSSLTLPSGMTIPNGTHVPYYLQVNTGLTQDFSLWGTQGWTARFDVVNLFDKKYEIRNGTGVGVGAPQWGPRRGFFAGLSKAF